MRVGKCMIVYEPDYLGLYLGVMGQQGKGRPD